MTKNNNSDCENIKKILRKIPKNYKTPPLAKNEELAVQKGVCIVCGGTVVEKHEDKQIKDMIYGPGSRDCFVRVYVGCYCEQCGLKYEFLPNRKDNLP